MAQYIPINKTQHATQGWTKAPSFSFAMEQSAVPVVLDELPHLIPTTPLAILQQKTDDGVSRYELVALYSLTPKFNLFITPNGQWLGGYIPAVFRGYPFSMILDNASSRHVLCIDQDSGLITDNPAAEGQAFFDDGGKPTQPLENILSFLRQLEQSHSVTQRAVNVLAKHSLIVPWSVKISDGADNTRPVEGLFRIDEDALRALDGDALKELQETSALQLAYAQLLSQHRMQALNKLYQLHHRAKEERESLSDEEFEKLFKEQEDDTLKFN